jgi:hypothetical protein
LNEFEDIILEQESCVITADCIAKRSGVSHETNSCMEKGIGMVGFKGTRIASAIGLFSSKHQGNRLGREPIRCCRRVETLLHSVTQGCMSFQLRWHSCHTLSQSKPLFLTLRRESVPNFIAKKESRKSIFKSVVNSF